MSVANPTPELLLAHALGELPAEESAAVRRWLLVQTDERVLEAYSALRDEAERRRSRLAHWAERPALARLERAVWRARAFVGEQLALVVGGDARRPVFAPLGSPTSTEPGHAIRVPPGVVVHVEARSDVPGHFAAFGVEGHGALHVMREDQVVSAGDRIELGGFALEGLDDALEVYLVLSPSARIPNPAPTDDAAWLAALLDDVVARGNVSFVRYVFTPSPQPDGGKQA